MAYGDAYILLLQCLSIENVDLLWQWGVYDASVVYSEAFDYIIAYLRVIRILWLVWATVEWAA